MQEFFMDYGLWLLIALLIVIGVMFLMGGRRKPPAQAAPVETPAVAEQQALAPSPPLSRAPEPIAPVAPEPVAVATPLLDPVPVAVPAVAPVEAAPSASHDDLLKLKGIGPKLNMLLLELGVTRYAQIAEWSDADIAAIDARLGNFKGRPVRDQWVDQARYLAAGDQAGFEAKYGKL